MAGDTLPNDVNKVDEMGRKTGYWIIDGSMKPTKGYGPRSVIEEGAFVSNKRQGLWKRYYPDGTLKSEITYKNNIPSGPYTTYYSSGVKEEEGNWKMNRNTGEFHRYHPNGIKSQEFVFDQNGIRNGVQKYFHDNGEPELVVEIVDGREEGTMSRYHRNGELKETKDFQGGNLLAGTVKTYDKVSTLTKEAPPAAEVQKVKESPEVSFAEHKPNVELFKRTGRNTLYNKDRLISQVGFFKEGRLWNGKWYRYDSNGLLESIEVYREGVLIGYAPLPED
jgi:antitoxin component YwqK of YwqJK toxin-antitoxin module